MTRVIEARARITAEDAASAKIAAIGKRISEVAKAQATVNRTGGQDLLAMARRVDDLQSRLAQVQGFRTLSRDLDAARLAMARAQAEASRLKTALSSTSEPTRAMQRDFDRATRAADAARAAFIAQGRATREARAGLEAAGMPISRLAQTQRDLEARTRAATAALERQKAAMAGKSAAPAAPVRPGQPQHQGVRFGDVAAAAPGVGGAFAARSAYDRAIEFEKSVNASQARGELTPEQAQDLRRNARSLGAQGLGFTAKQVSELQRAYVQAGYENSAGALALPTMQFSLFGDVDPFKAADFTVSALSAYRIKPKTPQEAVSAASRYQDIIAKGANISRLSVEDFAQGFKYSAPLASALGVSQEQLAAMIATQGQAGLRGDEAGVAVRSMLTRMVRPTADSRQALAEMGLRFEDYARETKPVSPDDLLSGLRNQGVDASRMRGRLPEIIERAKASGGDVATELSQAIIEGMGISKVVDKAKVSKMVARYVSSLGETIDVDRMFEDLRAKGVTPGQISRIFDAKQGTRLSTIMLDDQYQQFVRTLQSDSVGASARGAAVMNQGAVGAHNRLVSSYDNFILSLAESGVLDTASKALDAVASGLRSLAETSPRLLEFGTYATMAVAALGPLSLAVRGLALAAGAVGVGGAAPAAAAAVSGATAGRLAMMSRFGPWAFGGALAYGAIETAQSTTTTPEGWRYRNNTAFPNMDAVYEQSVRAQRARMQDPEAARGAAFSRLSEPSSLKAVVEHPIDVTGKLDPVKLEGQASVNVTVRVQGPGQVSGMSSSSSGHIRANAGTALAEFDTP